MNAKALNSRYEVRPAIVDKGYGAWVYSKAQELDIKDPRTLSLVQDLSVVMEQALKDNKWGAVSSNNLYWNATDKPVRVVMVPHPEHGAKITLVNPKTPEYGGWEIEIIEGCGSFPGRLYVVKRRNLVRVRAHMLDEEGFSPAYLEYDARKYDANAQKPQPNLEKRLKAVSHVQHEIDHLDGIVIPDIGRIHKPDPDAKPRLDASVAAALRVLEEMYSLHF